MLEWTQRFDGTWALYNNMKILHANIYNTGIVIIYLRDSPRSVRYHIQMSDIDREKLDIKRMLEEYV